jgi:hypothetical protein
MYIATVQLALVASSGTPFTLPTSWSLDVCSSIMLDSY